MTDGDGSTVLAVRVHPRSSKNRHQLGDDETLHVWVTAPAVEGAANTAVIRYLADLFELPRSRISIVSGEIARTKRIRVELPADIVAERIRPGAEDK